MAETLNTRVTRLEKAMAELAEAQVQMQKTQAQMQKAQVRMDNALAFLAEVRAQDQTEAREREKRIDGRIEKLAIAIGELIQHRPRDGRSGA